MTFEQLNLIEPILKALKAEGYTKPTPIQEKAIPIILGKKDLLGHAQTGTGKTAAFALPILQMHYEEKNTMKFPRTIKTLVLIPTRELAIQVGESFSAYGKYTGIKHAVIFGGVSQKVQTDKIKAGIDILIATPGRLLDLMNQKYVNLSNISLFVLDEADHMLDMGFIRDIKKIIAKLPTNRQTLFFSATMPSDISRLARDLLKNPEKVEVTPVSSTGDSIEQSVYYVNKSDKKTLLLHILKGEGIDSVLVFTRTKHGANKVAEHIIRAGITADAIHGNKSQSARQKALSGFKSKKVRVLVATDIAARGIDVDSLSHVINYELPEVPETYINRIGRTGRAGLSGTAISFCDNEEKSLLKHINKFVSKPINVIEKLPIPVSDLTSDLSMNKDFTKQVRTSTSSFFNKRKNGKKRRPFPTHGKFKFSNA